MTAHMTLSFVRATVQRAEHEGASSVELSIKDLNELLPLIESGMNKERSERRMKHAGWVSPMSLRNLRSNGESGIKLRRFKTAAFNTEVFFCDTLGEKIAEAVEGIKVEEENKRIDEKAQAIYAQWADQPGYQPWMRRGKSEMQQEARRLAREALGLEVQP